MVAACFKVLRPVSTTDSLLVVMLTVGSLSDTKLRVSRLVTSYLATGACVQSERHCWLYDGPEFSQGSGNWRGQVRQPLKVPEEVCTQRNPLMPGSSSRGRGRQSP